MTFRSIARGRLPHHPSSSENTALFSKNEWPCAYPRLRLLCYRQNRQGRLPIPSRLLAYRESQRRFAGARRARIVPTAPSPPTPACDVHKARTPATPRPPSYLSNSWKVSLFGEKSKPCTIKQRTRVVSDDLQKDELKFIVDHF